MMDRLRFSRFFLVPAIFALALAITAPAPAEEELVLSEATMDDAIEYFGVITGTPMGADDKAWLKQQWADRFSKTPYELIAQIDELVVQLENHQQDPDPIAMAQSRSRLIDGTYCTAQQTGDPEMHRLRTILAPDEVILAADCAFGMVVTGFDLGGLVASHGLMATITGHGHDPSEDRAVLLTYIEKEFDGLEPETKVLFAEAELRSRIADRFWSRMDGDPRKTETVAELQKQAASDLPAAARNLETIALQQLGSIDYLVEADGFRLTSADVGEFLEFAQPIAGGPFSLRDRLVLQEALIRKFLENPSKVANGWVAGYERANRHYLIEDEPAKRIAMLAARSAGVYCYLANSPDPKDTRTLDVIFRANPVVSSNCGAEQIERHNDQAAVEAGGFVLTEGDVKTSHNWLAFIAGRKITAEEKAFNRTYLVKIFNNNPEKTITNLQSARNIFVQYENQGLNFLREEYKRQFLISNYCYYQQSTKKEDKTLLAITDKNNGVLLVDCEKEQMTTKVDINGVMSSMDFLASLAGVPPFTAEERAQNHVAWAEEVITYGHSNRLALAQWWSMLDFATKKDAINRLRNGGFTHVSDVNANIAEWLDHAKLKAVLLEAKQKQCQLAAVISQGNTAIYAASSGRYAAYDVGDSNVGPLGWELTYLVPTNNLFTTLCS